MLDKKINIISLLILSLLYTLSISLLGSDNLNECIKSAISKEISLNKILTLCRENINPINVYSNNYEVNKRDQGSEYISTNKTDKIINELITEFGSQSIGISIETKKIDNDWHCLVKGGRVVTKYKLKDWIAECIDRGCGEICLSSIDNQGKACGINLDLLDFVSKNNIGVPLIIDGGFNNLNELLFFKDYTFVDGVIANTVFNKKKYNKI